MIRKMTFIILFAVFFLSSCTLSTETPSNLEQSDVTTPQIPAVGDLHENEADVVLDDVGMAENSDVFSVSFKPKEGMEELIINFSLVSELPGEFYWTYYYLCTVNREEEAIQSFEVETRVMLEPYMIWFIDIDFDGYLDMSVAVSRGTRLSGFNYYRYDAVNHSLEETLFWSINANGVITFPDTQQIISMSKSGGIDYRDMYQYTEGEYTLVRHEYAEWYDLNYDTLIVYIVEYDEEENGTEIYSTILSAEEYYDICDIRDGYLRFGAT